MSKDLGPEGGKKVPGPRGGSGGKFRCHECNKRFPTVDQLIRHVFRAHPTPDDGKK